MSIREYEQAASSIGGPGTTLVRVGSAVLFRAGTAALRVTGPDTPAAACASEAALAGWLADRHVPTIAVSAIHRVGAFTVMVMPWLDAVSQATGAQAGALAAACHQVAAPSWLRRFDPLAVTLTRVGSLQESGAASPGELAVARDGLERAQALWAGACSGPEGIVHGDLTPGNVLVSASGPHLHDFENAGVGPVLWDLVRPAHGASRFAGRDIGDRDEFFDAYRSGGGRVDMRQVQALAPVVDVIGAVWCLAGAGPGPGPFWPGGPQPDGDGRRWPREHANLDGALRALRRVPQLPGKTSWGSCADRTHDVCEARGWYLRER